MWHGESDRLKAVKRFLSLQISKEQELQDIVSLAAKICGTPTALITFIDEDTQYIRFKQAFAFDETARSNAFCNHVIEGDEVMIVSDAQKDERFRNNPLVTGNPNIRFYAGSPMTTSDGHNLGSLCVIDQIPGELTDIQKDMLQALSRQAIQLLEFDASLQILKEQYEEARQSAIEHKSFFENSNDCYLLLGRKFEVRAFNKSWARYVTHTYGKILSRGVIMTDYLHSENLPFFYRAYLKALKGTAVFEERQICTAEGYAWRMTKFEPAFDEVGEIIGVSVNSADTTQKVANKEMVAAQKDSLQEIAFVQSHELRRPVASILGLMNLLKLDGFIDSREELQLLAAATEELDEKIKMIIGHASETYSDTIDHSLKAPMFRFTQATM